MCPRGDKAFLEKPVESILVISHLRIGFGKIGTILIKANEKLHGSSLSVYQNSLLFSNNLGGSETEIGNLVRSQLF